MEERNKKKREERQATFGLSIVVMLIVILILVGSILVLKLDPHIPLIMCTFVLVFFGLYLHITWSDMMSAAVKSISECIEAIIIMMSIGMVVGAWVSCGTVPFIIYWGTEGVFTGVLASVCGIFVCFDEYSDGVILDYGRNDWCCIHGNWYGNGNQSGYCGGGYCMRFLFWRYTISYV